jgi:hypothetical protein
MTIFRNFLKLFLAVASDYTYIVHKEVKVKELFVADNGHQRYIWTSVTVDGNKFTFLFNYLFIYNRTVTYFTTFQRPHAPSTLCVQLQKRLGQD